MKPKRLLVILAFPIGILIILGIFLRQPIATFRLTPLEPQGADPARLESHVRMLSETFIPRDADNPQNLDRAAAYIRRDLEASGGAVSEQVYRFQEHNRSNKLVDRGPYRNVIATFGPKTKERIVVGAHYDAAGTRPGADDNASGVAGLLELARLLGKRPPALHTELVAYSTEEPPYFATKHMGSAHHAAALRKAGAEVRAMLALEMIGYFSDAPGSQSYPAPVLRLFYPGAGHFISVVGRFKDASLARQVKRAMFGASALPVYSINSPPGVPGIDLSDHSSYWNEGYPAVMINDTAFYRNKNYHTGADTAEKLDYRRMAQVVEGVHAALRSLSQ